MPIRLQFPLERPSERRFKDLDYEVMGEAFNVHNEFGRLFDEAIYANELCDRLVSRGHSAIHEFEVTSSHGNFRKDYYLDLVVEGCIPYELKAAHTLLAKHESQLINYLMLTQQPHGKLVNFRPASVESRFVSTSLTENERKDFQIQTVNYGKSAVFQRVLQGIKALVADWGTHLSAELYQEALVHLLVENISLDSRIPVSKSGRHLGSAALPRITQDTGLHVTSIRRALREQHSYLSHLLAMTPLLQIYWVNFNRNQITLTNVR